MRQATAPAAAGRARSVFRRACHHPPVGSGQRIDQGERGAVPTGVVDQGSLLLQLVIALAAVGAGLGAIAEVGRPAIDAARAWSCSSARDTVQTAAFAHLAATGSRPATLRDLTTGPTPPLVVPGSAKLSEDGSSLTLDGWTVTLDPNDGSVSATCTGG